MKKKLVLLSSITVMTLLTFNACGSSVTRDDQSFTSGDKDGSGRTIELPTKDGQPKQPVIESPLAPVVETPAVDNNDSTSMVKVDAKNAYKLSITLSKDKFQQGESGVLEYNIKEIYSDKLVENAALENITLSLSDKRYAKFVDFQGTETNIFPITSNVKANDTIRIKMDKNSGTTEITVSAKIRLSDGKTYELKNTIPVVVMKNVAASIAVNPFGTKFIKDPKSINGGMFVEDYVFHVVDTHGDKAKDGTYLQIGVVNDPKVYTLGYNAVTDIDPIKVTAKISRDNSFDINSSDSKLLNKIDIEDKVVVLPNQNRNDPTYLGAWSINSIDMANNKIVLKDDYTGNSSMDINDTNGLTFVIGDEDRLNPCAKTLANAAFYFPEGEDAKVKDGVVHAKLRYQPYMVGKTVFVYANAVINGERIGIAREIHLLGEGLESKTVSCAGEEEIGKTCYFKVPMTLTGYSNYGRYVTPGISYTGDPFSWSEPTRLNTECYGSSVLAVTVGAKKSTSITIGDSIASEVIINQK
jgi:hypothetical protein